MLVATAAATIAVLLAAAWCVERLVRAPRAWQCLLAVPPLLAAWGVLWWVRLPPTAEQALLAFGLADVALLAISVAAVVRLLGGFEAAGAGPDDGRGDGEGDAEPTPPAPRPMRPGRRPPRPSARVPSARGSGSRGPSRSSCGRSGRAMS